jgi:hypothetical protein
MHNINIEDFVGFSRKEVIASDRTDTGKKEIECSIQLVESELKLGIRVIELFTSTPAMSKVYPVGSLSAAVEKFNSLI